MSNAYWRGPRREGSTRLPFRDGEFMPDRGPPLEIPWADLPNWKWDNKTKEWIRKPEEVKHEPTT